MDQVNYFPPFFFSNTAFVLVACEDATSTPTSGPVTDPQTTADTDTSDSTTISDISDSTSSLETSNATDPVTSSTDGPDGDYNGANNLSGGEIAGIVIGSLAGVGLIGKLG